MINKAILSLTIIAGAVFSVPLLALQESKDLPIANAKKQIVAANRSLSKSLAAGDMNAVADYYTTDAKFMVPGMPLVIGKTGIKAVYSGMFKSGATNLKLSTNELSENGNLFEEAGTYTLCTQTGQELDRGKYLVVWRKEATHWKIYRDCFNTDLPAKKCPD